METINRKKSIYGPLSVDTQQRDTSTKLKKWYPFYGSDKLLDNLPTDTRDNLTSYFTHNYTYGFPRQL
ncbi:unnamed protein product [Schistosoma margrebowiei]|uniref:Uncharacterized protein n=1 Tax=Schistosoma margrebowiei TaxID=48269 RepID=A0A183LEF3_9TREM|nr:unnamed protein product [Schistosoma margrebowiei]